MELALTDHSGRNSPPDSTTVSPMRQRVMLTGVAVIGASVMAVAPATQIAPTLTEIQNRAVQLSAAVDPLTLWQSTLQKSSEHVQYGLNEISTLYPTLLQETLGAAPDALSELGALVTNTAGWQQVMDKLPEYGEQLSAAIQSALSGGSTGGSQGGGFEQLPAVLEAIGTHLANGEFTAAYTEINNWFLWSLGYGGGWEAMKVIGIPGEILTTLGAAKLGAVYDAVLSGSTLGLYATSVMAPMIGATFQFTESLDEAAAAAKVQDWEGAANSLANMPARMLNAFLNGQAPKNGVGDWPGLLTKGGTLETFLFTIPKNIAWALTSTPSTASNILSLPQVQKVTADAASTALPGSDTLVTLDVDTDEKSTDTAPSTLTSKLAANLKSLAPAVETSGVELVKATDTTEPSTTAGVTTTPADDAADATPVADKVESVTSGSTKAEATQSESAKSEDTTSADTKADSAKSETAKSEGTKSETAKPADTKTDSEKSDSGKAAAKTAKTAKTKSDKTKSDAGKAGTKTATTKSESKSDKAKSTSSKSGSDSGSKSSGSSE